MRATGFAFDCEGPRHEVLLSPYPAGNATRHQPRDDRLHRGRGLRAGAALADGRPRQGRRSSSGRHRSTGGSRTAIRRGEWWTFTPRGAQPVNLDAPVTHVSYYEADAYRALGRASAAADRGGMGSRRARVFRSRATSWTKACCRPLPPGRAVSGERQLLGRRLGVDAIVVLALSRLSALSKGAIGEYNGKFMVSQYVLRGGSCTTPQVQQMRSSYRNFFYPHQRWQTMGLRLAEDA
jgi:formylglycine-generating enzyme required for sulfatase activity